MIFDCFTFFNELDLLELRFNLLYPYVDKFVIAEGSKTHTGENKEFVFEKNKERFKKFLDKVIYIKVDDFPQLEHSQNDSFGNKWLYENFQRDAIMRGLKDCKDDDIIIISDCDEIPNYKAIKKYKSGVCTLRQWNFYYKFNSLNEFSPYSKGAKIATYKDLCDPKLEPSNKEACQYSKYGLPTYLRFCNGKKIKNGGWHFSYLGSLQDILLKRKSIVEQQFNTKQNMTFETMQESIDNNEDILQRGITFVNIRPDDLLPKYILKNKEKYSRYINTKNQKFFILWKIKYLLSKLYSVKYLNNDKNNIKIYKILGIKIKIRPKREKVNLKDKNLFLDYILNQQLDNSKFVDETEKSHDFKEDDVKLISFYLPQYHAIPENDKWFQKGFTEWFNVTKATPQYINHWQPHLPIDVGFYQLDNLQVLKRQIELAKKYGIAGFCFYYYWFNGQKLLEKPLEKLLADTSLNMPFCLFWDSSHWTKTWNGGDDKEVMYEQKIEDDTAIRFMDDFLKYAKDQRYIKIDNKPIFVISSPKTFEKEKIKNFIKEIRNIAKQNGFEDLYLMSVRGNINSAEIQELGFDAMLEFFPCGIDDLVTVKKEKFVNPKFSGLAYDMEKFVKEKRYLYNANCKTFKNCFPNWDNTARKCYKKARIFENTPENYKKWLKDIIFWTKENHTKNEQIVFINAWNEWAEGAHLEPDQKYGYAYLQATKEALEEN